MVGGPPLVSRPLAVLEGGRWAMPKLLWTWLARQAAGQSRPSLGRQLQAGSDPGAYLALKPCKHIPTPALSPGPESPPIDRPGLITGLNLSLPQFQLSPTSHAGFSACTCETLGPHKDVSAISIKPDMVPPRGTWVLGPKHSCLTESVWEGAVGPGPGWT